MLTQIHVRDLATILELHLHFKPGTTMISGETGAGKSVFIEAIQLALGGRASPSMIRPGKDKAEITLCFDITAFTEVKNNLEAIDLCFEAECIIRRIITSDGRSRCYVNGTPVTLQFIKELGEHLFHLHSQHEQQILLKNDKQRHMLDHYADHLPLVDELAAVTSRYKIITQNILTLEEKMATRLERSEYLHFQLEELNAVNLQTNEWEQLEAEQYRLAHMEELLEGLTHTLHLLSADDEQNIVSLLKETRKELEAIIPLEKNALEWSKVIEAAAIQLTDLESEISNALEKIDMDAEKRAVIENRMRLLYDLARKHKIAPTKLCELQIELAEELKELTASTENLQHYKTEQAEILKEYQQLAQLLSGKRQTYADKLAKEVTTTVRELSLPQCEFHIHVESTMETTHLSSHGIDKITFMIKTNPDQALQPLAKIASGGELSRLSLALHLSLATKTNIPTLIFDEVDTGLGGRTAEKIGKCLRKLGETYQVFCITHQAQVAALGHHHLLVEKNFIDDRTFTELHLLDTEQKTLEIARMLAGEKITEKTLEHAKEILASA